MPKLMQCPDCDGTGAKEPDCWLCRGKREVSIRRAMKEGWTRNDLKDSVIDRYWCICPRDECRGEECHLCEGSGKIEPSTLDVEETRVLICAKTDDIPPRYSFHAGRWMTLDHRSLLSISAARRCRDKGWITWFCTVFGDELDLTEVGEQEAERRLVEWSAAHDSRRQPYDEWARWADDGGRVVDRVTGEDWRRS